MVLVIIIWIGFNNRSISLDIAIFELCSNYFSQILLSDPP